MMLVSLKKRQTTTSNNQISHKEISDMRLIDRYQNSGYEAVADGVMDFFERRQDLQRPGVPVVAMRSRLKFQRTSALWHSTALILRNSHSQI
jgi:hypothetical protein